MGPRGRQATGKEHLTWHFGTAPLAIHRVWFCSHVEKRLHVVCTKSSQKHGCVHAHSTTVVTVASVLLQRRAHVMALI
eukprot:11965909-Alexandrium_andersonii.AAC.1